MTSTAPTPSAGPNVPAFPQPFFACFSDNEQGMTLRDYFAAAALTGILACPANIELLDPRVTTKDDGVAACAYSMADRMLAARHKLI